MYGVSKRQNALTVDDRRVRERQYVQVVGNLPVHQVQELQVIHTTRREGGGQDSGDINLIIRGKVQGYNIHVAFVFVKIARFSTIKYTCTIVEIASL